MPRRFLVMLAICLAGASTFAHASELLSLDYLTNFCFQSFAMKGTNMALKFRPFGERFFYSVNGGATKLSDYGEEVVVPVGAHLKLIHRHGSIEFSALPAVIKNHGFAVRARDDLRSFGQQAVERQAYLVAIPLTTALQGEAGAWEFKCVAPTVEAVQAALASRSSNIPGSTNTPSSPGKQK